jgi:hypothetical protein
VEGATADSRSFKGETSSRTQVPDPGIVVRQDEAPDRAADWREPLEHVSILSNRNML